MVNKTVMYVDKVSECEERLAEVSGRGGAVLVSRATVGLAAVLRALGLVVMFHSLVMTGQTFQIAKGETAKGFMLLAGTRADIVLRNEDSVAHEFVSPMLFNVPFALDGNGVFVKLPNAAGVRVDPGRVVRLTFDVPQDTKEFQNLYEVFWCNVHGKQYGDKMRGEVLVVDHRGEIGGG